MSKLVSLFLAASLAGATSVLAQDHSAHGMAHGAADPAYAAQMKVHEAMMTDMGEVKPSGNPDVDFVRMMIPHHEGAVAMAEVELKFGKDESRKALARAIIKTQTEEIAEMK